MWEALTLDPTPARPAQDDAAATWLGSLRALDRALWVNGSAESERFLFYEGATAEKPLLRSSVGRCGLRANPIIFLRNASAFAVHDVFVIQRDLGRVEARVFYAPSIPAGADVGFTLDGPLLSVDDFKKQTHDTLRASLVDPKEPAPPERYDWSADGCVMGRDPAIPVETAEGHQLYQAEANIILDIWSERFFAQPGTVIIYREDIAHASTDRCPSRCSRTCSILSKLRRASLVLWEGLDLAAMSTPQP